uniref:Activated RNA polymerase II transcriptional coactivator p15 n=1 Tax=Amphiprion percula TaxID=161767 RepID=A0A3P8TIN4_AMPPE
VFKPAPPSPLSPPLVSCSQTDRPDKGYSSSKGSSNGDDNMFKIGKMRNVSVRNFKGKVLIDIREHSKNQNGEMKPEEKGISQSPEQWNQLKDQISEIDNAVKRV